MPLKWWEGPGYSTKFHTGMLRLFYISFLTKKVPLSYTVYWKMVPPYIPSLELYIPFKVNALSLTLTSYSSSFNLCKCWRFFRTWVLKDCIYISSQKGKENRRLVFTSSIKREIQEVSRRSRKVTAKKCTVKKAWYTYKVVGLQSKPIAFFAIIVAVAIAVAWAP